MKKFIIKTVLFALLIFIAVGPVNMLIDPYQIFHYEEPVKNGVEPNKNFIKTKYILKNPKQFDSFLFGSSRAGFIDVTKLTDGNYYNMASSEALPAEHVRTLKTFLKNGIKPKNIIVCIDEISCFVSPQKHEEVLYRLPYPDGGVMDEIKFYLKYMDYYVTFDAYQTMKKFRQEGEPDELFTQRYLASGIERTDKGTEFTGFYEDGREVDAYWVADYYEPRFLEAVEEIKQLVELCRQNEINLRIAVNPVYHVTYKKAVENGYLDFLEALSESVPFYNFAGINDVTITPQCYYEASHFIPQIGEAMLFSMQSGQPDEKLLSQGFGMYVTKENKAAWLQLMKSQLLP